MDATPYDELAELVRQAQKGNKDAFALLHDKTAPILRLTIANKVGFLETEDILQETYLVAWRNLYAIDPYSVVAYLNTTARNLCSNFLRKSGRVQEGAELTDENDLALVASGTMAESANPVDAVLKSDLHERLQAALISELDDRERTALLLRYFSNMKNEAIAQQLGVSERTVKRIIAGALATLRKKLSFVPGGADIALALGAEQGAGLLHKYQSPRENDRVSRMAAAAALVASLAIGLSATYIPSPSVTLEEEPIPLEQSPDVQADPVCLDSWVEEGTVWVRLQAGAHPLQAVWCTNTFGVVFQPTNQQSESVTLVCSFDIPAGSYTLHLQDSEGNETTGNLTATLYPEPEEP